MARPTNDFAAQDLVYQSMEARTEKEHVALLRQALALDPECIDALLAMHEMKRQYVRDYVLGLKKILRLARKKLGKAYFKENAGMFWGLMETRPFMRVKAQLVMALADWGQVDDAIAEASEMLELNPEDNQGIRYTLLGLLLQTRSLVGATLLLQKYDEESSMWLWGKVLATFLLSGPEEAPPVLKAARKANPHVLPFLAGTVRPRRRPVDFYSPGDASEAEVVAATYLPAWRKHKTAREWLRQMG